tara:strand:+ start:189 stop:371 length:183 start_codon:yes stop_codon:yes gene_type:complete
MKKKVIFYRPTLPVARNNLFINALTTASKNRHTLPKTPHNKPRTRIVVGGVKAVNQTANP